MVLIKEWHDEKAHQWVLEFDVTEDEFTFIQEVEKMAGKSISKIVEDWFKWLVKNPEEGKLIIARWFREKSADDQR